MGEKSRLQNNDVIFPVISMANESTSQEVS